MKKLVSLSFLVILILGLFNCTYAKSPEADATYEIEDSDIIVTVDLNGNTNLIAFSIDVKFDDELLTPVSIQEGALLENSGDSITSNLNGNSYIADFVSAVWAGGISINSAGELFTIRFKATEDFFNSETEINVIFNEFLTNDKNFIEVAPVKLNLSSSHSSEITGSKPLYALKEDAASIKYMNDYGSEFKPRQNATRYEVIDALYNLFEFKNISNSIVFPDVTDNYKSKIDAFTSVGIINGYDDGSFGGDKSITRAEFVKTLTTAFRLSNSASDTEYFIDIHNHWAKEYINSFASKEYAKGYKNSDGTFSFKPDDFVSRSEVVTFINRIIAANGNAADKIYNDLSSDFWAYDEIMKVVN